MTTTDGPDTTGAPVPAPKPNGMVLPLSVDLPDSGMKLIFNPERLKGWTFTTHDDGTWTMSRSYGRQAGGNG